MGQDSSKPRFIRKKRSDICVNNSLIIGDNNNIYGDNNIITGYYNKIVGNNNIAHGGSNQIFGMNNFKNNHTLRNRDHQRVYDKLIYDWNRSRGQDVSALALSQEVEVPDLNLRSLESPAPSAPPQEVDEKIDMEILALIEELEDKEEKDLSKVNKVKQIKDEETEKENEQCTICCVNKKCVLFTPCNHLVSCSECSQNILNNNGTCPVCRVDITNLVPVYW